MHLNMCIALAVCLSMSGDRPLLPDYHSGGMTHHSTERQILSTMPHARQVCPEFTVEADRAVITMIRQINHVPKGRTDLVTQPCRCGLEGLPCDCSSLHEHVFLSPHHDSRRDCRHSIFSAGSQSSLWTMSISMPKEMMQVAVLLVEGNWNPQSLAYFL